MAVENLAVIITGRGGDLAREFRKIASEADESGKRTHSAWKTAGKGIGLAGAAIAGTALAIGVSSVKAAVEGEQSHARLVNAFKNAGVNSDVFAEKVDRLAGRFANLGYENDELESAVATLARATKDPQKAIDSMGLAADIAAGRNISLADATNILVKVQTGHVGALGRMGIATKDATGHTISQSAAMQKLTEMYGGQGAASADTFAGKTRALSAEWKNAQEKLGNALLPVLMRFADFVTDTAIPAIEQFAHWLSENRGPALALAAGVGIAAAAIFAFAMPITAGVVALAALVAGLVYAYNNVEWFRDAVDSFIGYVTGAWDTFGSTILSYVRETWNHIRTVIGGYLKIIQGVVQVVMSLIHGDWGKAWDGIKKILSGVWDIIRGIVGQALTTIKTLLKLAWDVIGDTVHSVWNGIVDFFKKLPGRFADAVRATPGKIAGIIAQIPGKVLELGGKMLSAGKTVGGKLLEGLKSGLTAAAGFAGDVASGIAGVLKNAWNEIARRINDFVPNDLGWGFFKLDIPDNPIPTFAQGGIVTRPTLAIIGEAGPEAIVPLTGARGSAGLGPSQVTVHVHVQGVVAGSAHDVGRFIADQLIQYERRTGKRWLGVLTP